MVSSEYWFGAKGFYNDVATQSLRFDYSSDPNLNINHGSTAPTLNTKGTISFWIKRGVITNSTGNTQYIIHTGTGTSDSTHGSIQWETSDVLAMGGYSTTPFVGDRKLRDTASWYHILLAFDSTSSTASERYNKIYINGEEQNNISTNKAVAQDEQFPFINANQTIYIGRHASVNRPLDSYLAEFNIIDGQALTPSSFGETKNGIWIPKKYTGSYGNNGVRLQFNQTGTGTASSSTIGADTSGNNNHWTSSGIVASDCNMPDSPENNFCTLNPIHGASGSYTNQFELKEGNLHLYNASASNQSTAGTFLMESGKWYWEILIYDTNSTYNHHIGVVNGESFGEPATGARAIFRNDGIVYYQDTSGNSASDTSPSAMVAGEVWAVAFDADNNTIKFYKAGSQTGNTISLDDPNGAGWKTITITGQASVDNSYWNYGQDSSFAGQKTSGSAGASDDNGFGDFYYTPPSGYLALCTSNLPETTISPNKATQADDYFNTVIWTGNGTNPRTISGVGFQPDWVWHKPRNLAYNHLMWDSSRGVGSNSLLTLFPNLTNDESDSLQSQGNATSFDSDGFIVNAGSSGDNHVNDASYNYVAWNWLANGTTPTKTYKVVVVSDSGNKYRFRNSADDATFAQSAVTLDLQEGGTYTFDQSDSSNSGHPLRFSTTSDGTHNSGTEYTTGVTTNGTAGSAGATTTITVASSAPTLYYYCSVHSGMGGQANTNTTHGSTNFDGSLLSVTNTNTTSGLSIVTYTSNGGDHTVGHGLGVAPKMFWLKDRDDNGSWYVYNEDTGANTYMKLEDTIKATTQTSVWQNTAPTSSVFSVGGSVLGLANNTKCVAYCFHNVEGYSKFGSYTGNGQADGTFIYTGFRPQFLISKRTDGTGRWYIWDNTREIVNPVNLYLRGDIPNTEGGTETGQAYYDFLSNGFKVRADSTAFSEGNTSGANIIYMAFAEAPFKYANAT